MSLTAGTTQKLAVVREVPPYGYFIGGPDGEVLLPYAETDGAKLKAGDTAEAFIYHDSEDRPVATLRKPLLQLNGLARLRVADVHPRLGCFLDFGLDRHLLLPLSELPERIEYRPLPGDEVYVLMTHDKSGRLLAKLATEKELGPLAFSAPADWRNSWVEGWVTKTLQMGSFVMLDGGVVGFGVYGLIPESERTRALRLGERVRARVAFIREDGRVNLSMAERKEIGRNLDADRILAFLKERPGGGMPYSDETEAELIKARFGISKSAFKRALGKLMREGLATQKGSWTYLTEQALRTNEAPEGAEPSSGTAGGRDAGGKGEETP